MKPPIFMVVAGELSGDILGAGLIKTLKKKYPNAIYIGIGGPLMLEQGLHQIAPLEQLSIMGLVEVLKHLPTLIKLKKHVVRTAIDEQVVAYIGIDAPDFNLRCARALKISQSKGLLNNEFKTIHYVSPSIWVWRENRVHGIKRAIDLVLCLFPFEVDIYHKYKVKAVCVGHRLADEINLENDTNYARSELNLSLSGYKDQPIPLNVDLTDHPSKFVIALLPGSRVGEVTRLIDILLKSIVLLNQRIDDNINLPICAIIPAATPALHDLIDHAISSLDQMHQQLFKVIAGNSRLVMQASDAVLLASGTASLEAMLLKKPMVVVYKFSAFTAWLAPKIIKIRLFSLPNILSGAQIVPELFQADVTPDNIVSHMVNILDPLVREKLTEKFLALHLKLRFDADNSAAKAVSDLLPSLQKGLKRTGQIYD